jgi:hypothetical protein
MLAIHPDILDRDGSVAGTGAFPRSLTEIELAQWLESMAPEAAGRWSQELRARSGRKEGPLESVQEELLHAIARFMGPAVGPWRDEVEPLLHQAAHLYGNVAALRALAVGEVVEEVQLLREVLFRLLFREATPEAGSRGVELRELLRLNRVVDQVVTHADIAHVDALFFNLLHGTGVTETPGEELMQGIRQDLEHLLEELGTLRSGEDSPSPGVDGNTPD